jgi:hypothetical protein
VVPPKQRQNANSRSQKPEPTDVEDVNPTIDRVDDTMPARWRGEAAATQVTSGQVSEPAPPQSIAEQSETYHRLALYVGLSKCYILV